MTNNEVRVASCELRNELPASSVEHPASCILRPVRHRITFATQRTLAYVSVLELGRVWERSLRRADVPLKYSQGYNPRPKLNFAAPLPVGCGSEADLMDILLDEPRAPDTIRAALEGKTPQDLIVQDVVAVAEGEPALSEQLTAAEYRVWLRDIAKDTMRAAVDEFLTAEAIPMAKRGRKYRGRTYDLRPLVEVLHVEDAPAPWTGLWLRVQASPGATGRPDEVLKALGVTDAPRRCTRIRLILNTRVRSSFGAKISYRAV